MRESKPVTRKQQAERTRMALFEKGCELLSSVDDFDDFSVEDITDACGVSKGTFYVHFKSKGAFFYNVKHKLALDANRELIELLRNTDGSAREALTEFVREWVRRSKELSLPFNDYLQAREFDMSPTTEDADSLGSEGLKAMIRAQVQAGVDTGEFVSDTPVDTVVSLIIVTLTGFGVYLHTKNESANRDAWADEAVTLLDEGVLRRWLVKKDRRGMRRKRHLRRRTSDA